MARVGIVGGLTLTMAGMASVDVDAQPPTETHIPVFVTIVDARPLPNALANIEPAPKTVASFPYSEISGTAVACDAIKEPPSDKPPAVALDEVWGLLACATGRSGSPLDLQSRIRAAKLIATVLPDLAQRSSTRAVSDKADYLLTAVIQTASLRSVTWKTSDGLKEPDRRLDLTIDGRVPKIVVQETARKSQIQQDAEALLKVVGAVVGDTAALVALTRVERRDETIVVTEVPFITAHEHAFRETRATIKLDVSVPADRPAARLAQGLPTEELAELLKALQARIKQKADEAEAEKQKKALAELLEQCPPTGIGVFSPLRILSCRALVETSAADRAAAAEALGSLGSRDAVLPLTLAVRDEDTTVRGAALRALGKLSAASQGTSRQETPAGSAEPAPTRTLSLVSGPAEHWFISADVIVTSKDQINVDDEGTIGLADPPSFYVGFGFLLGDLASTKRSPLGNIAFKALIKGTKSPLDSIGAAVALRGEYLKKLGLNFELLSPFAAYTWSKDAISDTRVGELRYGLSVNIDKAIEWLK